MLRLPTLAEAAAQIRAGTLTPLDLVEHCLARIRQFDERVQAWVHVDEEGARRTAEEQTRLAKACEAKGLLFGIPIGIKDIIDVAGMKTLCGTTMFGFNLVKEDAPVVAALRREGAIILGKTVTTQFACFDPSPTRNPWNLDHTPGGSSSGSAAAVAMEMCVAALGTQTGGSILRPAAYCGVAGLKPTFGQVSTRGVHRVSQHLDHVGPIARSAEDLSRLLAVLRTSRTEWQGASLHLAARQPPNGQARTERGIVEEALLYTTAIDGQEIVLPAAGLLFSGELSEWAEKPPVLLVPSELLAECGPEIAGAFRQTLVAWKAAGAEVREIELGKPLKRVLTAHRAIMAVDAAAGLWSLYQARPQDFAPGLAALLQEGFQTPILKYATAFDTQASFSDLVSAHLRAGDALVLPATTATAPPRADNTTGDPRLLSPFSLSGHPAITLPASVAASGLPWGVQLVGRHNADHALLALARWCEMQLPRLPNPPLLDQAT